MNPVRRARLCLLAVLLLAAATAQAEVSVAAGQRPSVKAAELARRIHAHVNAERVKDRLSALTWDKGLSGIAAGHSRDMVKRKYLAHNSPERQGFPQRYRRAGYTCRIRVGRTTYGGAENIALAHLYDSVTTVNGVAHYDWNSSEKIAGKVLEGWMKSPGHRENILMPHWKREGIGVEIAADGKVYVTQNFC